MDGEGGQYAPVPEVPQFDAPFVTRGNFRGGLMDGGMKRDYLWTREDGVPVFGKRRAL